MERLKQKADGSKRALKTFKGYAAPSESVIKIFKNRIKFFNRGKLAGGASHFNSESRSKREPLSRSTRDMWRNL